MRVILSNLYKYSPFDHGMKFDEIIDRNTKVEIIIMAVSLAFVSINNYTTIGLILYNILYGFLKNNNYEFLLDIG